MVVRRGCTKTTNTGTERTTETTKKKTTDTTTRRKEKRKERVATSLLLCLQDMEGEKTHCEMDSKEKKKWRVSSTTYFFLIFHCSSLNTNKTKTKKKETEKI